MDDRTPDNTSTGSLGQGGGETRKRYTKPQIQEVPLRPEEAVLGACKTASVSGPAQHRCNSPGPCSSLAS
jgi:hypothetical protein